MDYWPEVGECDFCEHGTHGIEFVVEDTPVLVCQDCAQEWALSWTSRDELFEAP